MVTFWATFAKTGDPNGGAGAVWPAWDATGRQTLVLNTSGLVVERSDMCDFWDSIGYFF